MTTDDPHMDRMQKILDDYAEKIGEHFDGVLLLATCRNGERGDIYFATGSGNYFTRVGLANEYMTRNDEATREQGRGNDED